MLKEEIDAIVEQIEQLLVDLSEPVESDKSPLEQWLDSLTIPEGYISHYGPCARTRRRYPY